VRVNANERDEITASVAAHSELGSRWYDTAVAEGLVERIGDEIDKRIDARLGGQPQPGPRAQGGTRATPAYQAPPAYQGASHLPGAGPAPTPSMPAAAPAAPRGLPRRVGGLSGMVLGLGSMGLGVGATAVVVSHHVNSAAAVVMILLIWADRDHQRRPTRSVGSDRRGQVMFERFTDRARRVVVAAQEEARMLGHNHIGSEHLLLGPAP